MTTRRRTAAGATLVAIAALLGPVTGRAVVAQAATGANERLTGANAGAWAPAVSGDGRYIAFQSNATQIVPDDNGDGHDIYVRDRWSGGTEYVSLSSSEVQANGDSAAPSISADGRYVVFVSTASNLVAGDGNGIADVFLRDRVAGTTVRVSRDAAGNDADGSSGNPVISADGRYVAFDSLATDLVIGDTNGVRDVFRWERATNAMQRVSIGAGGEATAESSTPSISADGRFVAFESDAQFLEDVNGLSDVYRRDLVAGTTELVSRQGGDGGTPNGASRNASISADGNLVAYQSTATNILPDANGALADVFVQDVGGFGIERVSVSSSGSQSTGTATAPAISADGRFVGMVAEHDDLGLGDTNTTMDVVVRDRALGTTHLVAVAANGVQPGRGSESPALSNDGRVVAYTTPDSSFEGGDPNGSDDVFVHLHPVFVAPATPSIMRVSESSAGASPNGASNLGNAVSGDGIWVAFESSASNLVHGDTNGAQDVFVRNRITGKVVRVSQIGTEVPGIADQADISMDGRFVTFSTTAALSMIDTNGTRDVYRVDRDPDGDGVFDELETLAAQLVSVSLVGTAGNGPSGMPSISADGSRIAFISTATDLVGETDTNGTNDIFVRDLNAYPAQTTTIVSVDSSRQAGGATSLEPTISADGQHVSFYSTAPNLVSGDTNGVADVFVTDVLGTTMTRVSVSSANAQGNAGSLVPDISETGRYVAFESDASNLVAGDVTGHRDIFIRDRDADADGIFDEADAVTTRRASLNYAGGEMAGQSWDAALSWDGRFVAFRTNANFVVSPDDNDAGYDVYVRDRDADVDGVLDNGPQMIRLLSEQIGGASGFAYRPDLSRDGRIVSFFSTEQYVSEDTNGGFDTYVADVAKNPTDLVSRDLSGWQNEGSSGDRHPVDVAMSGNGRFIAYTTYTTQHPYPYHESNAVYLFDRATGASDLVSPRISNGVEVLGDAEFPHVSDDGRFVLFTSRNGNMVSGDTNGVADVFLRDRLSRTTLRVSVPQGESDPPIPALGLALSPDGRYVVFSTARPGFGEAPTDGPDTDPFVWDRMTGQAAPLHAGAGPVHPAEDVLKASISADGNFVALSTRSTGYGPSDANVFEDVYLIARSSATATRVSRAMAGETDGHAEWPRISADGRVVVYHSYASNLVAGDTNAFSDVFAWNRVLNRTDLVSRDHTGALANGPSDYPTVSEDGRWVAFRSSAALVGDDTNLTADAYVRDRVANITRLAARDWAGRPGGRNMETAVGSPVIDALGSVVAYSTGSRLVGVDRTTEDVFATSMPAWPLPPVADVMNLTLTADTSRIGAGASSIPLASIPIERIPALADSMQGAELGRVNLESSPIGAIPIGAIGLEAATLDPEALDHILLSSVPADWETILAGTPLAGLSLNTLSLKDVLDNAAARAKFLDAADDIELSEFGLDRSLLRGTSVVSALLGSTPIGAIDPPGPETSWCALLATNGFHCPPGTNENTTTMLGLDIAGAPIGAIPIGAIPIGAIPIGAIPIGAIPIGAIPLLGPIGAIPIGAIPIGAINSVVDCSRISCDAADDKVLRDAAAMNPSAIKPGATVKDLAGAFGDITLGQVIVELLARSDFPWESVPVDGLQDLGGAPTVGYTVSYEFTCTTPLTMRHKVTVPAGFSYVDGSARIAYSTGTTHVAKEPSRSGNVLTFDGLAGDPCSPGEGDFAPRAEATSLNPLLGVSLTFRMRPGFTLGTYTASAEVIENGVSFTKNDQAPVEVVEISEPNDTKATATSMQTDHLILGHIAHSGDQDVYKITVPPGRSRMTFSLSNLDANADYDLVVHVPPRQPLQSSPIGAIPIGAIPVEDHGSDFQSDGTTPPETLADIPIGAIDLGPAGSVSANRGGTDERAEIITPAGGGTIYVRVVGYNGSFGPRTYVLRGWTYGPPPLPPAPPRVLPFDADAWEGPDESATRGTLPASVTSDRQTLFLVNQSRLADLYGPDAAREVVANLNIVAARPEVRGVVLPLDGNASFRSKFAAWDTNLNSIEAANDVVRAANDVVATYRGSLPQLRYIVNVGSDEVLPFARVIDDTTISNEIDESIDLAFSTNELTQSNASYASVAQGHILTDAHYGAFTRIPWLDRELPLLDVSVSRLVETPADIVGQLRQYVAANGLLNPTTALITGYDFLTDGAEETEQALREKFGPLQVRRLINENWTREDLIREFTGATPVPGVAAVNAHYSHRLAQPAGAKTAAGLFAVDDVPAAPSDPLQEGKFAGRVLFTVGCHSGLNVPDTLRSNPTPEQLALSKDWAQTWGSNRAAVYIGNTGFGYGETVGAALSEKLATYFARNLRDDSLTMGEKWVRALHTYFQSAGVYGVYDEKVIIEATMYGMPMYRIGGAGQGDPPATPPATTPDPVTGLQTATIASVPALTRVDDPSGERGTYWEGPDGIHSMFYRPIQPVDTVPVTVPGTTAHGVMVTAMNTVDVPNIDAWRARPTIAEADHEPEPEFLDQVYPANFAHLTRSRAFGQESSTLVLIAGQYRPSDPAAATGTQRLVTSATMRVAYSSSSDFVTPEFAEFHVIQTGPSTVRIFANVSDDQAAGVRRVAALYRIGTATAWQYVELSRVAGSDTLWQVDVTATGGLNAAADGVQIEVAGQAQDAAGNVGWTTRKGIMHPAESDGSAPSILIEVPANGSSIVRGSTVRADYSCSDATSGVTSCSGPVADGAAIDTSSFGTRTFTVSARDAAGNTTTKTVTYRIVGGTIPPQPDAVAPVSQFTAGSDIVVNVPPVRVDRIGGRTTDNDSGVGSVVVTYTPVVLGAPFSTRPALTCDTPKRTCVWKADLPPVPGRYEVSVVATDRLGNVESPGPRRNVTVV